MAGKKTEIDMRKLESDLRKFGKQFGDASAQAVTRWGVSVCRELAKNTQPFGTGAKSKRTQEGAITADAYNVLLVVDTARSAGRTMKCTSQGKTFYVQSGKYLSSPKEVNDWISINRTRRRRRTAKLSIEDKKTCTKRTLAAALKLRKAKAGEAKGGWLVAGQKIARSQSGAQQIQIGARYIAYAQKAAGGKGNAIAPKSGWNPTATLNNLVKHSSDTDVLRKGSIDRSIQWGLKNTLKWYRMAMRPKKQKP